MEGERFVTCKIPVMLQAACALAAAVYPSHSLLLILKLISSWGLAHLPPSCNSNYLGYQNSPI
ncbi:hypothetical protein CBW55_09105 [Yersinia intermedia]|nr:hypothetical protein CBW55_09105 [Yersinia intermedia]OWF92799.1 hypothetical protein B4916_02225 [Yersinia intermedia]